MAVFHLKVKKKFLTSRLNGPQGQIDPLVGCADLVQHKMAMANAVRQSSEAAKHCRLAVSEEAIPR